MNKMEITEKALMLVLFLFFVLLVLVIVEQGKASSQIDNNAMQLEIRAKSIAQYGTYED